MIPQRVYSFGTYFVTTQTWGRRSLFQVDELARLFIETLYAYRAQHRYLLHDFVVMRNHVHFIVTSIEITLERVMQLIKGGYSHAVGKTGRTNLQVWQPGFTDHRIRDAADYARHQDYLLQNPVRAGLSLGAAQYPYSSANVAFELDPVPQRLKPISVMDEVRHG